MVDRGFRARGPLLPHSREQADAVEALVLVSRELIAVAGSCRSEHMEVDQNGKPFCPIGRRKCLLCVKLNRLDAKIAEVLGE